MNMKLISSIVFLAICWSNVSALSLPFGVSLAEVKQLLAIVDPQTCGCRAEFQCAVPIPNAHLVGFRCSLPNTMFCCNRKKFMTSPNHYSNNDMRGFIRNNSNLKNLLNSNGVNVNQWAPEPQKMVLKENHNVAGEDLKSVIVEETKRGKVIIKPADKIHLPTQVHSTDNSNDEAVLNQDDEKNEKEDKSCQCVKAKECAAENLDYTFGKSCSFGFVRCCQRSKDEDQNVLEEGQKSEEVIEIKNNTEDAKVDLPSIGLPYQLIPSFFSQPTTSLAKTTQAPYKAVQVPTVPRVQNRIGFDPQEAMKRAQHQRYLQYLAQRRMLQERQQMLEEQKNKSGFLEQLGNFFKQTGQGVSQLFG